MIEDEILAYFLLIHGVRSVRFAAPEYLIPLYKKFTTLKDDELHALQNEYKKNKKNVYKIIQCM